MKTPKSKTNGELKPNDKLSVVAEQSKIIKTPAKTKKSKSSNQTAKAKQHVTTEDKPSPKPLSAKDLAKIAKKKEKKQAQKLRQRQKKLEAQAGKEEPNTTPKDEPKSGKTGKPKDEAKQAAAKPKAKPVKMPKDKDAVKRVRDPADEKSTVFVGNLPINTKRVQLMRLFKPYGAVKSIRLRTAGGKQLFKHKQRKAVSSLNAYVVLESVEIAEKSLALNGTEFKDMHLRVTPAAKVTGRTVTASQPPSDADAKRTIFVGSLKYSANEQKLHEIFSSCGEIEYIRCLQEGEKGCKGVAYVCFAKADSVGLALELNETLLDDRPIHVERYAIKKLGAKKSRDASAAAAGQTKSNAKRKPTGAKKRIDKKQSKESVKTAVSASKKKSEYRGVKVDGMKAKKPKKKSNNQMNALAKKIAPKAK